jgi:BASS family bile acid:Na+ symporter
MSADKLLTVLFNAGIGVSIIATVLSLGMSFTVAQVLAPLRRVVPVILMIVVNCAVIPAAAWGLFTVFGIKAAYVSGATLAAVGAAGAFGLKAAQLSKRADLPLALSAVVVLQILNLAAVPLWAGQVVSGASISAVTILKDLLLLVLLPLAIGLLVRARYADHAKQWQPELVKIANLALGIAVIAGIAANWSTIVSLLWSRVLLASLVVVVVSLALGFAVGGKNAAARASTGLVSGVRFTALGMIIIGTQLHSDSSYLGPAIVFALVDMIVVMIVALEIGRRARAAAPGSGPARTAADGQAVPPRTEFQDKQETTQI